MPTDKVRAQKISRGCSVKCVSNGHPFLLFNLLLMVSFGPHDSQQGHRLNNLVTWPPSCQIEDQIQHVPCQIEDQIQHASSLGASYCVLLNSPPVFFSPIAARSTFSELSFKGLFYTTSLAFLSQAASSFVDIGWFSIMSMLLDFFVRW